MSSSRSLDSQALAGDPIAHAAQRQAEAELLAVSEQVLDWLYDRRAHMPEELLDHREAKHRKVLREAIKRMRGEA